MTVPLNAAHVRAVVVDIEGTTTPLSFVYDVLFPYARFALATYVREHLDDPAVRDTWPQLRADWAQDAARGESPPIWRGDHREAIVASIVSYAEWLMDRDRKAPGLKTLQGHIWTRGYEEGALKGEVFPDVPDAFARWKSQGLTIGIYSSGSVLAQQLLFRTTAYGDLTRMIDAYFDTAVGAKNSPDSYRRIADKLRCPPDAVLFISDTPAEVDAARAAGWKAVTCARSGYGDAADPATIHTFSAL